MQCLTAARNSRGTNNKLGPKKGTCLRCGGSHKSDECRFKEAECNFCHKTGHLAKVCFAAKRQKESQQKQRHKSRDRGSKKVHNVAEGAAYDSESEPVYSVQDTTVPPLTYTLKVNGKVVEFEIDTGSGVTIMSRSAAEHLFGQVAYTSSSQKLHTYAGHQLEVVGRLNVTVSHGRRRRKLPLYVINGAGPNLLGRAWLKQLDIAIPRINNISYSATSRLQQIIDKHTAVFQPGLGELKGQKVHLSVDPTTQPVFCKPRPVPFALRDRVNDEIDRLVKLGVFRPITHAQWAAPLVSVLKSDKRSIRLCGDYKVTINRAAQADQYTMPSADGIFARLAGKRLFAKLDLSEAYTQLVLDDESQLLAAVNTPKGLFAVTRLPYGTSASSQIFQRELDRLLGHVTHAATYIDDIIIGGEDEIELLQALDTVLTILEEAGLRLKLSKCEFMKQSITYLGHTIDKDGLHPTADKLAAIRDAPKPINVGELRSFIGLITFYGKFIPRQATIMAPLYALLQSNVKWVWADEQERAFEDAKRALLESSMLVHFDNKLPVVLSCDASPTGVSCVLAHVIKNEERPVLFISRTLSTAERNYSQLEREAIAIIFGVVRLRQYLLGRHFVIYTDHKPLLTLFSPDKTLPPVAAARVLRWSLILAGYQYKMVFRKGTEHGNVDALSRLPLPSSSADDQERPSDIILLIDDMSEPPCSADDLCEATRRDPVLAKVILGLQSGSWPSPLPVELAPFHRREMELSVVNGLVMWGQRVIIPQKWRQMVKNELHEGHFGSQHMKALARSYVWWPNMDAELEATAAGCNACALHARDPPKTAVHPWPWPTRPWVRLHIDYAGPVDGVMLLVLIDAHSKWLEAVPVQRATAEATTSALRHIFATHGLPEVIVSDNGSPFTAAEFENFCKMNGIRHLRTPPFHPASNGAAERAVALVKAGLSKLATDTITAGLAQHQGRDLQHRLDRFLLSYRRTPQSTTSIAPAEMLMKRSIRTRLDLVKPSLATTIEMGQAKWPAVNSRNRQVPSVGCDVMMRNYASGDRWVPATVVEHRSPHSILVKSDKGITHRHPDQLRKRVAFDEPSRTTRNDDDDDDFMWLVPPAAATPAAAHPPEPDRLLRRSQRQSNPPNRLTY